ncbi:MAG: carboxypeptidase-like regulatory domain-containing protein [Prevotellaceae bacterium]|nr:carboxypeptidase-like regulatory domain-containing protein [Prevotellaceae bacterium]
MFGVLSTYSFAEQVQLSVVADGKPAVGVYIYVNGKIKTVTNEQGKAPLRNLHPGDSIRTSYLGYKAATAVLTPQGGELNFALVQEVHSIGAVEVSPVNDMSLFKQKLKWGLQEAALYRPASFYIVDTLGFLSNVVVYRECSGSFTMPLRGYTPFVRKAPVRLLASTPEADKKRYRLRYKDGEAPLFERYKIPQKDISLCFAYAGWLSSFDRNFKLSYLGKDSSGYEQFYFYIPNNDWRYAEGMYKARAGGVVYLDSSGIISRLKFHKTSLDISVESYEFDVAYTYDAKGNEVIPGQAAIRTYKLDKELNVVLTRRAHLKISGK